MVYKIRIFILLIIIILLCFLGFTHKGYIETNLLKTLLPQKVINSTDIVSIANKSSSVIKVIFENDNQEDLDKLKHDFIKQIDTDYFEITTPDVSKILNKYLLQPTNFLSKETKILLKGKKYDEIYAKSIEKLYNPTGIQLTTLDKDPYLLLDDFILSNRKISDKIDYLDGKYYDYMSIKFKKNEALSPDISNKKIRELINFQRYLSDNHSKIYLAGAPIHSYYTSTRSVTDINIICILSTLIIIFLTLKYFRDLKLLLPMALSIIFGMLLGFVTTKLWFENFQVITMVFSTTLIGIGIDYSYHYFFADKVDSKFIKNLSFSFITTVVPFALLYFTGIELLEQVAVFTIFGLLGIYLIVLFIYPCFNAVKPVKNYEPQTNIYKICLFIIFILSMAGFARLHFNDNLTALYTPTRDLLKAENLYNKISGEEAYSQIITVKADNINKIIETEEKITKELDANNIEYISLSKIFPSVKTQYENYNLVKNLYHNNLNNYSDILSANQIRKLKTAKFVPIKFDNMYLNDLMLNEKTSLIVVFGNKKLNLNEKNVGVINLQSDIRYYMTHYRHILMGLFPVVLILLYMLLACLYNYRKAFITILPSIGGIVAAILMTALIYGELNLFSVITIFLVLGFTIDYSIFRINSEENTESAVFVSCVTTSFSFLMLALCGFKLLSSMALILFFGITTSYIIGYLLIKKYFNPLLMENQNHEYAKWFQVEEQSAGKKRLYLSWFLFKIFGKNILYVIAFFMSVFTFIFASKIRKYSEKYLKTVEEYTGLKSNLLNKFKHILSYANSLVDKMLVYSGNFNESDIIFDNDADKKTLFEDIEKKCGVFFICNHIGNIEILQTLLLNQQKTPNFKVNIFMSNRQSQIFNDFLKTLKINFPVNIFQVEEIDLNTGIELKENLNKGDMVFIAGDRLAQNNDARSVTVKFLSRDIKLPQGAFKLAKLMEVPTYFISAIKIGNKYHVILEKQQNLSEKELVKSYVKFMERTIKINPFQFFHFYDFFN